MKSFSNSPYVAVIGAGPYGLSVAAHLASAGVEFRIFGMPMQSWLNMPKGMFLKSEGCASNLFDADRRYTLQQYCAEHKLPYSRSGTPVSLETFTRYSLAFQQQLIPEVENTMVTTLHPSSNGFQLKLTSGETVSARKVIVAVGASYAAYVPPELAVLGPDVVSHSSAHSDLSGFKDRDLTVIGGGQSALETAALLNQAGSHVRLVVRQPSIRWNEPPTLSNRSIYDRVRHPVSPLGAGLGPWLYCNAPMLFCHLPQQVRIARVRKALGPAGAWWLRDQFVGRVPVLPHHVVRSAEVSENGILLRMQAPRGQHGTVRHLTTNHVIAATGYRFKLSALPFISEPLISALAAVVNTPVLSRNFESTVPGLYFTGLASANQFGPDMRFLHGAAFTARQISRHIVAGNTLFQHVPPTASSSIVDLQEIESE